MGQSQLSHIVALLERCAKKRGWTHVNTQLLSSFFLFFNLTVKHKYTSKQRNNSPFVQFRQLKYFINDSSHEWKHFWQTYRTWDLHLGSTPPSHTRDSFGRGSRLKQCCGILLEVRLVSRQTLLWPSQYSLLLLCQKWVLTAQRD